MATLGEWLARLGLLWLDGSIVALTALVRAGPFLLAGSGALTLGVLLREGVRPVAVRRRRAFTLR